ncbi:hypothetical protein CGC58_07085 [Capnocytophaga stomatis]|uniref:Uncharacterized protein n=1 Tax=Capnocytophaga stomatis TaxID=1848904 RepID=A0A250FWK7_9FLAO|nr:hypothetical protein [Capnocytophaga stomatis]ATA89510.1 hypothetical protein CGC58_07085 [Capnocytophaga stomatis]
MKVDKNQQRYLTFEEGERFNNRKDASNQISKIESKKAWGNSVRGEHLSNLLLLGRNNKYKFL